MKRILLCLLLCFGVSGCASAAILGFADPSNFTADTVDWCANFSCDGSQYATPQPWVSVSGSNTGYVGLDNSAQGFYSLQQGTSWLGDYTDGMGLIYNGAVFGNTPADIAVIFDQPHIGVGAWIQADVFGAFDATITLYDALYQPIGSYTASGISTSNPGTALFIGGISQAGAVWAATFSASGTSSTDFSIGSLGIASSPEPASFLLIAPALGALALLRRRRA